MNFDIVILPSYPQVEAWRKGEAGARAGGLFAQTVTTFDAWIADLWELHGDGRAIVGGVQREVMLHALCRRAGGALATPGVAPLAASCMRKASGIAEFEEALDRARRGEGVAGLAQRELDFLGLLARYSDLLADQGLVELGSAAKLLADRAHEVFPRPLNVLFAQACEPTWVQDRFFAACPSLRRTVQRARGADGIPKAPEGTEVRFAFPSGPLASPGIIADIVRERGSRGSTVIACKNPAKLFGRVSAALVGAGFDVRMQSTRRFSETEFGRAFLAMFHCLHDDPWNPASLVDVLYTAFSGVPRKEARIADRELRCNRIADREEELAKLRAAYEPLSQLEELASDPDADILIGAFEQMAQAMQHRPASWRAEQLAAMRVLRNATAAARGIGAGIEVCASVLEGASVPVSARMGSGGPVVVIESQANAAQRREGSCATLVVADLTSQDYPVADRDDAAKTLLAKLGLPREEAALTQARCTFSALLSLPTERVVLVRPLGDANAGETYASAVLEEFIDAYRADPSATDDIDNDYRLPADLQAGLVERGEELLYANVESRPRDERQPVAAELPFARIHDLSPCDASDVAPPKAAKAGEAGAFSPSPSQIETYLECPFKWFATKRLGLEEFGEQFGPREQGAFAHEAIETFYRRFQESGEAKVNAGNIEDARALMREVVAQLDADQYSRDPGKRLVAKSELERREFLALARRLEAFLDFEAALLPAFHPAYFEYRVEFEYAGYPIVGYVDRIDVDDAGRAVIIDYKGSVKADHEIAGKTAENMGKVQARIYAKAVEELLGLKVVAILYMSHGKKHALAGAYDPNGGVEAAHLPYLNTDNCSCGSLDEVPDPLPDDFSLADLSFPCMLEYTEQIVGEAIRNMSEGVIEPNPSSSNACAYCSAHMCPKRGA